MQHLFKEFLNKVKELDIEWDKLENNIFKAEDDFYNNKISANDLHSSISDIRLKVINNQKKRDELVKEYEDKIKI